MFSSGLSLLLSRLFRLEHSFSLFFSQSLLIVLMFIAGLFSILNIASIILPTVSIIYLFYLSSNSCTSEADRQTIKLHFKRNLLVYASLILAAFIFNGQFVGHNDEFNFWASSVKEMLSSHSLPDASSAVYYKMYHPGLTLYHYVNLRIFNKLEPNIYISYLLLNLSAINVISHRFRNFKYLNVLVFIFLTWLSYKVLGLGFKLLIADQYLANALFACLFIISFSISSRKLIFLIIPICALALVKHPGVLLGVILLLLLNVRRFTSLEILNNLKKPRTGVWIVSVVLAEIALFWKLSTAWSAWVDSHLMNGLFMISMSNHSLTNAIFRFIHGNISIKDIEIFKQFIDALIHLKIGMLREVQMENMRLSFFIWLAFCLLPLILVGWKGLRVRKSSFNLIAFLVISGGFVIWILGIYLLAINAFQQTSEGLFPSMSRYIGIYLLALVLYSFSFVAYWGAVQKNKKLQYLTVIGLLALIGLTPSSSSIFLSEQDFTEGKFERDLFNKLDPLFVSKLTNTSKVCIIYNGPSTYVPATVYGILPAHAERADTIASFKSKLPDYAKIGCSHFIGFCVSTSDCSEASNRFSSLFKENQSNQIWLKTYELIKTEF